MRQSLAQIKTSMIARCLCHLNRIDWRWSQRTNFSTSIFQFDWSDKSLLCPSKVLFFTLVSERSRGCQFDDCDFQGGLSWNWSAKCWKCVIRGRCCLILPVGLSNLKHWGHLGKSSSWHPLVNNTFFGRGFDLNLSPTLTFPFRWVETFERRTSLNYHDCWCGYNY